MVLPAEIGSLDAIERLKCRILYFERLSGQFFSFILIVGFALLCFAGWLLVADMLALSRQGTPSIDAIVALPSFRMFTSSLLVLGVALVALIAYSRAVNRANARAIRRARIWAGLASLILISAVLAAMSRASITVTALLEAMAAFFLAPLRHWTGIVELSGLIGATLFLQYYYQIASSTMARLKPDEIRLVRESADDAFAARLLRTTIGVPRIVDYMSLWRRVTTLIFVTANACYAISTMFFMVGAYIFFIQCVDLIESCRDGTDLACIGERGPAYLAIMTAVVVVAFVGAPALGSLIASLGRRFVRFSIEDLLRRDERPPILFLRPFRDDQVRLRPANVNFLSRIGRWLASIATLDELMLEEGTPYGPVVAIGNPGDRFPPYGAARGYFDDKTWQHAVADLAARSRAIVICVDDYEGVWWEIENVVARHLDKTLLLLPPRHAGAYNAEIVGKLADRLARTTAAVGLVEALRRFQSRGPDGDALLLAVFADAAGRFKLSTSSTFTQIAYLIAVREFLRLKWGFAGSGGAGEVASGISGLPRSTTQSQPPMVDAGKDGRRYP